MNRKKYLIVTLMFLLVGTVSAIITLENGDKIVSDAELQQTTEQQISNYMDNTLEMTRYKIVGDNIIVYYNITYLEPTHVNDSYRVFTQEKPFKISGELWELCINKTTNQNCRDYLVDRQTPYYLVENNTIVEGNETTYKITNTTIKSTWLQASEEKNRQYTRALEFKSKSINNDLDELFGLI